MKILIAQTSFLGDVVLTTPLMVSLREQFPEARFSWLTTPLAASLIASDPWIDRVIPFDKNGSERSLRALLRKAQELRSYNFDVAYGVQRSARTSALLALAGIPKRIGFTESRLAFLYSQCIQRPLDATHDVVRNLALVSGAENTPLRLVVDPQGAGLILDSKYQTLDPRQCVVLGVGSAWATKRWTVGGFIEVARAVIARGLVPVLLGGSEDQARADIIAEEVPEAVNLALPLAESMRFISQCRAVVCHDSLLLHVASAFKKPTVVIFCSTVPSFGFGPWQNPQARIIEEKSLPCKPCGRHGHNACPTSTWACSLQVSSQEVIKGLDSVLS